MQTTNRDLMQQAREALKGRWGLAVGGNVIYLILGTANSSYPQGGLDRGSDHRWSFNLGLDHFFSVPFPKTGGPALPNCLTVSRILPRPW